MKKSWIVRMECVVIKDVYVEDCTEEQARKEPFEHATDECELEMIEWEIKSVLPD